MPRSIYSTFFLICLGIFFTINASVYRIDERPSEDATEVFNKAFKTTADTIIIPNPGAPWIVRPLKFRGSNKVIIWEKGTILQAKKGAFEKYDKLLSINKSHNITLIGYGATLQMNKAEYNDGQWRHCLGIFNSENINVYGFTIRDSGGDGIKVDAHKAPFYSKNIHIKDCVLDNNRRQGISIISAENLLMENCIIKNTTGTNPQSGVDLEPNRATQRLVNIRIRNVEVFNNTGYGLLMWLTNMDSTSLPVSVRFENCRVTGNGRGGIRVRNIGDNSPKGLIEYSNCTIENNSGNALEITNKSSTSAEVKLTDCQIVSSRKTPIVINPGGSSKPGGVRFINLRVKHPKNKTLLYSEGNLFDISGNIIVESNSSPATNIGAASENISLTINERTISF